MSYNPHKPAQCGFLHFNTMPLETTTYIDGLEPTNPVGTDSRLQGDDHIRLLKSVLKTSFPSMDTPMTATGKAVLIAANQAAARTALGSTTVGDAVFVAASTAAARTALGVVPSVPFRNRIVNGNFAISQEFGAASTTITAAAALKYVIDQHYAYCTGANITGQQITVTDNSSNRYRFTGAASNATVGFATRLPASHTLDMTNATATLSVKLSSSSITTVNWQAYYANTLDTFGTLASPTRTSIASGSFTISSTEATYSAQISVPTAAKTGVEIVYTTGALTAGNTLTFGDNQFEKGALTTSEIVPEVIDTPTNLLRCGWFYTFCAASFRFPASSINQFGSTAFTFGPMRATPVVGTATGGGNGNCATITLSATTERRGRLELTSAAAGDTYYVDYQFSLSARL